MLGEEGGEVSIVQAMKEGGRDECIIGGGAEGLYCSRYKNNSNLEGDTASERETCSRGVVNW